MSIINSEGGMRFHDIPPLRVDLSCVVHRACFADDGDFDLTRIGHFILNFLGEVEGDLVGLLVGNLFGADDDAEFAAGLNGVCLDNAW